MCRGFRERFLFRDEAFPGAALSPVISLCSSVWRRVVPSARDCQRGASGSLPFRSLSGTFFGFDSFEGFADSIVKDQQMGGADIDCKRPGGMNDTSYELVASKVRSFRLQNVQLH